MIFDLGNVYDLDKYKEYVNKLYKQKAVVEVDKDRDEVIDHIEERQAPHLTALATDGTEATLVVCFAILAHHLIGQEFLPGHKMRPEAIDLQDTQQTETST